MKAVVLAGGTGGAKLAAGMQEILGEQLTVIANTGDDIEVLGVHVSPDPDLCTYWLSGEIDEERGWGIKDDAFTTFERLVELGAPRWFGLSDRDLALCLRRRELLDGGLRPTEVQLALSRALAVRAAVLPMCDEPVRTRLRTKDGWLGLQEYLIRDRAQPQVLEIEFAGVESARVGAKVRAAVEAADAIVIGPSNPVISIGPILAVPGMRELLAAAPAPVVAVSPFVAGKVLKGPTGTLMEAIGEAPSIAGIASLYDGVSDALVIDALDHHPTPEGIQSVSIDTLMDSADRRRAVAATVLAYCDEVARAADQRGSG